jgi:hypothetical protein
MHNHFSAVCPHIEMLIIMHFPLSCCFLSCVYFVHFPWAVQGSISLPTAIELSGCVTEPVPCWLLHCDSLESCNGSPTLYRGSTYQDNLEPDQLNAALGAIAQNRTQAVVSATSLEVFMG